MELFVLTDCGFASPVTGSIYGIFDSECGANEALNEMMKNTTEYDSVGIRRVTLNVLDRNGINIRNSKELEQINNNLK